MTATVGHEPKNVMPYPSPTRRVLISVFLLIHLFLILVWSSPIYPRPIIKIWRFTRTYMEWSGLDQRWNLFAPEPLVTNAYLVAQITYGDGQKKKWKFPTPEDYGYYRRYFMDRQVGWTYETLGKNSNAALWPDAARYVARLNNQPNNPPVKVELIRHWSTIALPMSGQPETWNEYILFTYSVVPGDLL
jgi:hypothetical protein